MTAKKSDAIPTESEKELARQMGDDLATELLKTGALRRAGVFHEEQRGKQCTIKPTLILKRGKADALSYVFEMTEGIKSSSIERKLVVRKGQLGLFTGEVADEDAQ